MNADFLSQQEFEKVEIRIGTIVDAEPFSEAKHPAYKLFIDFGEYGMRKSSAQITKLYTASELIGKQVVAVVNFPPKQIAHFMSECLVLGSLGDQDEIALLTVDKKVENGLKVG